MRSRSASMSARGGRSNVEHLLEDLTNRRQGVEPARLDIVEEPPQLGVVADGRLQVPSRPGRRDLEHLLREVRPPPPLELAVRLEPRTVLGDLLPQLLETLATQGLREHDRRAPALGGPE